MLGLLGLGRVTVAFAPGEANSTPDWWPQTHPCFHACGVGRLTPLHTPLRIKDP